MQTDIAKYAMWLFNRTGGKSCEQLPDLYDQLRLKNPIRSESFSFQDFEALFRQWRWQQLALGDTDPELFDDSVQALAEAEDQPSLQIHVEAQSGESRQTLSDDTAPISDYRVVTEMLIEQLVAAVKQHIAEGWTPLGGISRASSASSASYWAQAMVKRQVN